MAQVTVRINGYAYTVGCEDGQEGHLQAMAEQVESRIDSIKALGGQSGGEARMLALAALLMADELYDMRVAHSELQSSETQSRSARPVKPDRDLARTLGRLADRAEAIASTMEHP
ncbi:MAG: cell division protein ZapA [Acidisphaera sp.]|nr:cell division protein ZapA [Acidisphaera sp.]